MRLAAIALLLTTPAATPAPALELTKTHELEYGKRLELRGSFDALVRFLEPLGEGTTSPPAIRELSLSSAKLKSGKMELEISILFVPANPPPQPNAIRHPSAHARRLDALRRLVPARGWIESYSQNDSAIAIKGRAESADDIATFMQALAAESCLFDSVTILRGEVDGSAVRFSLTAKASPCAPGVK